jgi:diguanylate cyclase (GGDEF)-like protein
MSWWLVALGIELHHLEDEMRYLASYDELTGIMSRRAFFNGAERLHVLMRRQNKPLTLAYLDLDDFKEVNDTFGHVMGDAVLKAFTDVISSMLRRSDIVGRIGGEEFALILPDTDIDGARHLLEQIRNKASEQTVVVGHAQTSFTVSVGLAFSNNQSINSLSALIEQADKALYQAKSKGKNCVVQYSPTFIS